MAEDLETKRRRERERYAALTPEQKKAKGDAANARTKAKLERAKRLEEQNKTLRKAARDRYREKYAGEPLLDFVPFRMWLIGKQRQYASTPQLAAKLGLDDGKLRHYLDGYTWESGAGCDPSPIMSVSIDVVDRCLTNEGSTRLDDLYPHVPGWDNEQ